MAQSTAGIKLYYGTSIVTNDVPAIPTEWTELPDITSIPALGAPPAKLETTTLAQTEQKTYINGLMDLGGSFEFGANMTPALVAAVEESLNGRRYPVDPDAYIQRLTLRGTSFDLEAGLAGGATLEWEGEASW